MAGRVLYACLDGVDCRDLVANFRLGTKRIGVQTDGGLQILLPQDGLKIEWDRCYYEIAFEVTIQPRSFTRTIW